MSDPESRREDAKMEAYYDKYGRGPCPKCGSEIINTEHWPQTQIDPASGRNDCSNRECDYEEEYS